jgi:hypothetical protein
MRSYGVLLRGGSSAHCQAMVSSLPALASVADRYPCFVGRLMREHWALERRSDSTAMDVPALRRGGSRIRTLHRDGCRDYLGSRTPQRPVSWVEVFLVLGEFRAESPELKIKLKEGLPGCPPALFFRGGPWEIPTRRADGCSPPAGSPSCLLLVSSAPAPMVQRVQTMIASVGNLDSFLPNTLGKCIKASSQDDALASATFGQRTCPLVR